MAGCLGFGDLQNRASPEQDRQAAEPDLFIDAQLQYLSRRRAGEIGPIVRWTVSQCPQMSQERCLNQAGEKHQNGQRTTEQASAHRRTL